MGDHVYYCIELVLLLGYNALVRKITVQLGFSSPQIKTRKYSEISNLRRGFSSFKKFPDSDCDPNPETRDPHPDPYRHQNLIDCYLGNASALKKSRQNPFINFWAI